MKDRIPLYPGRLKLNPVSGQPNTYDMVRADEPTQEGTPLNKETLLKDATAALYGLPNTAVPDDVLSVLSRFQNGLGNEYVWERTIEGYEFDYTTTGPGMIVDFVSYPNVSYSDTLIVENGNLALLNPTTIRVSASSDLSVFTGKFIRVQSGSTSYAFYKILEGYPLYIFNNQYLRADLYEYYTSGRVVETVLGYVNSPSPNAYPPAVSDGYTYIPLGQMGAKVQIATGSYTGTGTYGSSNPNSLTFDFEPKIVFLYMGYNKHLGSNSMTFFASVQNYYSNNMIFPEALTTTYKEKMGFSLMTGTSYGKKSSDGKKIFWYHTSSEIEQHNKSGEVYRYIAIG